MVGADLGREIAVEREPGEQRGMAIDMAVLEGGELGDDGGVGIEHARKVHEFGKADDFGVIAERQQVGDLQLCARGFEGGCRYAGGEVDPDIHHRALGATEEIDDGFGTQHIGHFVRIADRGGDAMGQHAAIEFERGDQRGFDMQVRVDEARHGETPAAVDLLDALVIGMGADDPVADNGDVGLGDRPGNDVEHPHVPDHQVGLYHASAGLDHAGQ